MLLYDQTQIPTQRTYTDEGFLVVPARIARTGVQDYSAASMGVTDRKPDDIIKVFRPAEEVFDADSLKSFQRKPVTQDHPPVLVDASNYREYSVGSAGDTVQADGDYVSVPSLTVNDARAIAAIEGGKCELSNGYTADIEWSAGVTDDGIKYDAIQRRIRGNHIAIVAKGRAGSACRIADTLNSEEVSTMTMEKILIDGVGYEASAQVCQAVAQLQKRLTDMESEKEESDEEKEKALKEKEAADKAKEEAIAAKDAAEAKVLTADQLDARVAERAALIADALAIAPGLETAGKSDTQVQADAVAQARPGLAVADKSEAYISATFDILTSDRKSNSTATLDVALATAGSASQPEITESQAARNKMMADARDQWKQAGA